MIHLDSIFNYYDTLPRCFLHGVLAKMAMTPLQRKAAFKSATTMQEVSMANAARRLGVSYNHLMLVLAGEREGSVALKRRIAQFLGRTTTEVFDIVQGSRDRR